MNAPYHLISISVVIFVLYASTWLSSKLHIITKQNHRQIWNTVLLFTFFATALLGIILALQVNYKFQLPGLDTYMLFHVDIGMAMAIVAVIHLTWHWNYYINFFKRNKTTKNLRNASQTRKDLMNHLPYKEGIFGLLFLGFQSMVVQTIFIRENLSLFTGNELIIGIIISFWMVFVGLGSIVVQKAVFQNKTIRFLFIVIAVIPLILFAGMNLLRFKIFIPGTEVDLINTTTYIALFQLPFCLIAGMLFPQLVYHLKKKKNTGILGTSYALETVGSIVSGLILGFVLFHVTTNLNILIISLIISSFFIVFQKIKIIYKILFSVVVLFLGGLLLKNPVEKKIKSAVFINQEIQVLENSIYGEIAQTSQFEQINIYENHHRVFTSGNEQEIEEIIHYPLIQHANPQSILVITSNISQALTELSLHSKINTVDFIETNPVLLDQQKPLFPDSIKFHYQVHKNDPIWFLNHTSQMYDVAILHLPPPTTLNYNRFYTRSFYELINKHLNRNGIINTSLPNSMNYINTETTNLIGSFYHTINQIFKNLMLIPGTHLYVLASNNPLSENLTALMESREFEADYINPYYMDLFSINQRREQLLDQISGVEELNTRNNPVIFFYAIESWFGKIGKNNKNFLYAIAVLLTVLLFTARNKFLISIFVSGFTVSGVEFLVIFLFQMTVGSIYHYISVITALFMAGLAIGAFWQNKINPKPPIFPYQLVIAILLILISITMKFLADYQILHSFIYVSLGFLISMLCGIIFVGSANKIERSTLPNASKAYGFDLFGAALGAFVFPIFIIPFVGFFQSIFIIAVINLLIGLVILIRK